MKHSTSAPGAPGITPGWTTGAKMGVGTAFRAASDVWFTLAHGIVTEVYYPRNDRAAIRDCQLIVTSGDDFFSEERRDTVTTLETVAPGVPGYRLTNTCREGRYQITKSVITDPRSSVLLQHVEFRPLIGALEDYRVYVLTAPHLANDGHANTAWVASYKGVPMMMAQKDDIALAIHCTAPWLERSAGFAGASDGWSDLRDHKRLTATYDEARDGNVALVGRLDLAPSGGNFCLALGFGDDADIAAHSARGALICQYPDKLRDYVSGWSAFQERVTPMSAPQLGSIDLYRNSLATLVCHESKTMHGGMIASLSIPWGYAQTQTDAGGYHVIWPRDQVEGASALLAAGISDMAQDTLAYLVTTQEADGHWPQNMWSSGRPYWPGLQADETALVIMLWAILWRNEALDDIDCWDAVRRAAGFLVRNGPSTQQDRWEENSGFTPFTIATLVCGLLGAAVLADQRGEGDLAGYLRETADCWHDSIDRWCYVSGTPLAAEQGIDGYYLRINPRADGDVDGFPDPAAATITLKNLPEDQATHPAWDVVATDALALVRFGLRAADDPRVLNTVKVIDAKLRQETATGTIWHRYSYDGYGETADGGPFRTEGIGRGWPLLAGERAHYELALGNADEAARLLGVMSAQTSPGGLLPEQVWDAADIPEYDLHNGHPSGSGMPLVWAHAEYVKLVRSLHEGRVFDLPQGVYERYVEQGQTTDIAIWRPEYQTDRMPAGRRLRVEALRPFTVVWTSNGWQTQQSEKCIDRTIGIWTADLATAAVSQGGAVEFTLLWDASAGEPERWEGRNYGVAVD